ncbi:MAG: zinc ribbon domain-containing protein [Desulfobulbus sp.]|jgi:putative FmdB family regulatory protein|uniref:FmdB family zinc ribbon protein n=1 Tax=Desulfobulbus sp. TaxID=895 RepID=UPI002849BD49|nr:zinc ribbon domain-containing protein [Desulfobulbus sp.]MDR2550708.1 zinc ribbon domain-containing protein [Desulfobulbus sp.]
MPVYEYECSGCQKIFEVQQRMADKPISVCPTCGGSVRKLISMSSFQLKGGGWYTDGYSNGTSPCADSGGAPSCPGGGGGCCQCPAAT